MSIAKLAALVLVSFVMCTAWAGGELGWSHSTLTGPEAKQRFLSDSEQCMEYARLLAELPQDSRLGNVSDTDPQNRQELLKRQHLKMAVACMSTRGWSASINPHLNAGP